MIGKKINLILISDDVKKEIQNITKMAKFLKLYNGDQIFLDLTKFDKKNYHDGIKFTFFAKNVRGEVASRGVVTK